MALYLVESHDFSIDHGRRASQGVVADYKGKEKIYLHVLEVADAEIALLKPRVDDDGNTQHDRLALPRVAEWWFAVEGEASWPGIYRPKLTSRCTDLATKPRPVALGEEELGKLRKAGVKGI